MYARQKTGAVRIASTALALLLAAPITSAFARQPTSPLDERRAFAEKILASANMEWGRYFASRGRVYKAPKSVFMQLPNSHPAHGFGYDQNLLTVELGSMIELQRSQPNSADFITALIIAHEVAHHVQRAIEKVTKFRRSASVDRELEADCAAGWWLTKANARSLHATGKPFLVAQDLAVELPRALRLLSGPTLIPAKVGVETHGHVNERVSAFELGTRSRLLEECGTELGL